MTKPKRGKAFDATDEVCAKCEWDYSKPHFRDEDHLCDGLLERDVIDTAISIVLATPWLAALIFISGAISFYRSQHIGYNARKHAVRHKKKRRVKMSTRHLKRKLDKM